MRRAAALCALLVAGCAVAEGRRDTGLDGLAVTGVAPSIVVPGTRLVVFGSSFVDESLGATRLRLRGTAGGRAVDGTAAATFVSSGRLEVVAAGPLMAALGGRFDGTFDGTVSVEVDSTVDGALHATPPFAVTLELRAELEPAISAVGDGVSFVNHPIEVQGEGFLLGGDEGQTLARLRGCFTPAGQTTCGPDVTVDVPARPATEFDRTRVIFPYATSVSGIGPGTFAGTVEIVNAHTVSGERVSGQQDVRFDIQRPAIFGASTTAASLGQYLVVTGGGFVGGADDEFTVLHLTGEFTPADGKSRALDLQLVPEFVAGPELRYVLGEDDPLGAAISLRTESGSLRGMVKPIVQKGAERIEGTPVAVSLQLEPVKQVVYLNFVASYVASLRRFGLRAVDPLIRKRVLTVAARDYAGTNVEFRDARPDDFALYAEVDIAGPDPNGLGLLGYDNSPGKDTGNLRLYDRIGGVNATTQEDGYPGFGGVFVESFFGFSQHPNGLARELEQSSDLFDRIFDPFRVDRGGHEVTATELARLAPPELADGAGCPAADRAGQIACAVYVLGNLIGTTMTHEVGHSLGLANPYAEGFHNFGDAPNRLMDAGGDRPFEERAELLGQGPARFCLDELDYLRKILPTATPPPPLERPACD